LNASAAMEIQAWCTLWALGVIGGEQCGGPSAIHGAPSDLRAALGVDAALLYFMDLSVARAFVERFACGLAVVQTVERGTPS
jgi:hypothetical protein